MNKVPNNVIIFGRRKRVHAFLSREYCVYLNDHNGKTLLTIRVIPQVIGGNFYGRVGTLIDRGNAVQNEDFQTVITQLEPVILRYFKGLALVCGYDIIE